MAPFRVPSDTLSGLGRAAHDAGLGVLIGGNLFGNLAMHPALADVSDATERGMVVNRAWGRYGAVHALALGSVVAGWAGARPNEAAPRWLSGRERVLARARDVATAAVAATGVATAVEGVRFSKSEPGGAVPLADGSTPADETPPGAARIKRRLNALSSASLAAQLALVAVNAGFSQQNFRRPPLRRVLRRRY